MPPRKPFIEKWKQQAIREQRVCIDCGQAIAKYDVPRWESEGKLCWNCADKKFFAAQQQPPGKPGEEEE